MFQTRFEPRCSYKIVLIKRKECKHTQTETHRSSHSHTLTEPRTHTEKDTQRQSNTDSHTHSDRHSETQINTYIQRNTHNWKHRHRKRHTPIQLTINECCILLNCMHINLSITLTGCVLWSLRFSFDRVLLHSLTSYTWHIEEEVFIWRQLLHDPIPCDVK